MPTVEWNKATWDGRFKWDEEGEEWSRTWGGTDMEWYGALLPRIHRFVPTQTILEIAPGFGRWTQFLKEICKELIVVDLSTQCIQACQKRFARCSHITYYVNDGKSLDMIADNSLDFVFSFDSLVHVDDTVISAYVSQLSKKLKKDGAAFIHHSNLGEYPYYSKLQKRPRLRKILREVGILEKRLHERDFGMTAGKMSSIAEAYGLRCISQEIIPWDTQHAMIDCLSTLTKENSIWARENRIFRNPSFMKEANYLSQLARLYASASSPAKNPSL